MKIRKLVLGVVLTLLAGLAQAATIVVTTAADTMDSDGLCSLREAMLNAENADQSGSTDCPGGSVAGNMIVFDESLHGSTIFLANQEFPHITRPLEIIGPERGNPSALTIDAGAASRVFVVRGVNEVMLSDLTLTNGRTFSETSPGSTVYIADGSVVRMERIHVSHGIAQGAGNSGGAIAVVDSSLEIEEGVFLFNQASGSGGVIFSSNSELEIVDTLAGINAASGRGGVVHAVGGKVAIVGSGFSANTTSGESAFGGALFMDGADLDMINTDLSGNVTMGVNAHGGGLYLRNANLTIVGGAIEGNVVQGAGSNGGGISTFNADVMLSGGCHILDNTTQQANGWGGGMRIGGGGLEMSNCLVSGNQTFGNNAHGGGIYVIDGNAVIENSQLVGNQTHGDSAQGGGIRVRDGDLTMTDSLVENNATNGVSGHGGGIHHRTGETDLQRIRVSGNQTIGDGGQGAGIYLRESELTLFDAWIDNNQASNARGAGLALLDGLYSIERATISGNHGTDHGGGLMVAGSQLWIVNSTISGNELEGGTGSALFGDRSDIELIHVTVADNINPPGILSHLYVFGEEENRAELTLYNTLIVNNRCGANDFGTISGDGNMGTHSSCPAQVVPAAAIDIKPLADNGGFAPTHELDIGSLAINAAGNCSAAFGVDEDQRGAGRPGGSSSACDVGAFETDQPPAPVDLSVALSIDPPFAAAGEQVEILIDVSNQSDSWASEVEAQINLGSALILQSADHDSGTFDPGTGLWTVGLVGPEEKQTLSLTVELATSGTRDVAVLVSGFQPDPEPGNDQASAEVMEPPPPAEIVVNTLRGHTASDGLCGLHEAIINANNANQSGSVHCAAGSAGLNAIDFHPDLMGGVIQLEQDLPPINANLSITGPGLAPDSLTILGSAEVQGIFAVPGPVTFELRYLTLSGGQNLTGNLPGGALRASGGSVISLATMKISSNSTRGNSSHGGGVAVEDAVLSVIDSEFTDNEVLGGSARGGALFASNATVSIERSTIANNRAQWSTGGGIHLAESSELSMVNSTISGNRSPAGGAGMYVAHSVARLTHSTVAWNIAGPPNLSLPQGIFVFASAEQPGELILENTLLVQPSADQITCASPSAFASVSSTGSLSTHAGCFGVATPVSDIALLPLADNGGFTQTHALGPDSVAVSAAGNCASDFGVTEDQRGQPRPGGSISACDVGAYEFQGEVPEADLSIAMTANHEFRLVGQQFAFSIQVSQSGPDAASGVTTQIDWPSGLSFLNTNPSGADFDSATGLWTIGALNVGQTATLTVRFVADELGQQTVTALVSALEQDPDASNNTASVSVDVVPEPEPMIVTTLADEVIDDGACSLREAIINANNNDQSGSVDCPPGSLFPDEISFDPALAGGTLVLNGEPLPTITDRVSIHGPIPDQADSLTIDGNEQSRLFHVTDVLQFELWGMTLTGGRAGPADGGGGAMLVENQANVDLRHVRFIDNQAQGGQGRGGALSVIESQVFMRDCELSGNSSVEAQGGAIFAGQEEGEGLRGKGVRLERCLLADNHAGGSGGAIYAENVFVDLFASTLSGNQSDEIAGGLFVNGGDFWLRHATLVDNQAGTGTGDLVLFAPQRGILAPSRLESSLIVQTASGVSSCSFSSGASVDVSSSLATDADCQAGLVDAGAVALGALADNGGPTRTHALEAGSVAIDLIADCDLVPSGGNGGGLTDQRGQPRPGAGSSACDAGAYERQGETPDRIFHDRFGL